LRPWDLREQGELPFLFSFIKYPPAILNFFSSEYLYILTKVQRSEDLGCVELSKKLIALLCSSMPLRVI